MDTAALAFEHAPLGLALLENRVVQTANIRFWEIFRSPPEMLTDMAMAQIYPSIEDFESIGARGLEAMRESGRYDDERIMKRLDGDLFWCRVRGRSLTPEEPFRRGVWSFSDLSEARPVFHLTARERDVAMLTCKGLTSKEIGRELALSYRTVEQYRARLLEKFGARNIAELVARFSGMPI
jgi:DNA-binding CsgD family transcriptional regulator